MNIDKLLRSEVHSELEQLKEMETGSEQYKVTVDGITKLADRVIEIEKLDIENQEKAENREIDTALKKEQMKEEKKDRLVKNCISVAGIVLPLILTVWGTKVSLKFEETGTVTTSVGRGFINKLLPKK